LKGIQTLAALFPEDEECLDMQRQIIRYIMNMNDNSYGRKTLEILDRRQNYTRGDHSPIFFKKV